MARREYYYNTGYSFFKLAVWLVILALLVFLINITDTPHPGSFPLSVLALFSLASIYRIVKRRIIPSLRKETGLTIDVSGIYFDELPAFIRWAEIESIRSAKYGWGSDSIQIRLNYPDGFLDGWIDWRLWLQFKMNSVYKCQFVIHPRSFNTSTEELMKIIDMQKTEREVRRDEIQRATTIQDIKKMIRDKREDYGITLYGGASEDEIANFEQEMGVQLPDDLKVF